MLSPVQVPDQIRRGADALWDRRTLGINGAEVTPEFFMHADDINTGDDTWADRISGASFTKSPSGNEVAYGTYPLYGQSSAVYNSGKWHESPNTTLGEVTTEDIVFEALIRSADSIDIGDFISKRKTSPYNGWSCYQLADGGVEMRLDEGVDFDVVTSPQLAAGLWGHLIFFGNRDGSGIWYLNGVAGTAVDISSVALTLASAHVLQIGRGQSGQWGGSVQSACLWLPSDISTHLQPAIAQSRFIAACGGGLKLAQS